ncbi:hypothetical protein LWP59_26755 [Amycolatopsis acidiphila]|uniref:Glyoxalase n=1 Tax=Amycolatopsis acidiphila TaxID=715473 RepID=A0A558AIL4_9PSEU|nr:glyoxalase [Amycolatopsis acidiphila]TVT24113.1 glyoxalase [Amycolatopsis acidiphila]UIJ57727.1 hypothetical protein LWP59_26755 [Amycolatopsis acidiphila]GHG87329.1 hypothetical protein GCM10017788_60870 [Amycolatopsis acidiphila]
MIELYVLDVPEFRAFIDEGAKVADQCRTIGNYVLLCSNDTLVIDRRQAGVRQAVWYSAVGALRHGKVAQFDKDALRVEPE